MKVTILNHTAVHNRGNEALLVTIITEVSKLWPDAQFCVGSVDSNYDSFYYDSFYSFNSIDFCSVSYSPSFSRHDIAFRIYKMVGVDPYKWRGKKSVFDGINNSDVIIFTGGDLFSSDYGTCIRSSDYVYLSGKKKKKVFLMAQSIGPFRSEKELKVFRKAAEYVDIITCRESISYEYIRNMNLKNPRIELTADSAFLLPIPDENEIEKFWSFYNIPKDKEVIGLALSQSIATYARVDYNDIFSELCDFVDWLIKHDYHVLFIPHFHGRLTTDDRIICEKIFRSLNCPSDMTIAMLNHTASEYKGLISKCSVFIGARTHSTIASLSSYVPTVAIAYSVKAYGILKDIFGEVGNDLIVDVKSITLQNLIRAFEKALEVKVPKNQIEIQICRAMNNFKLLKELLE